MASIVVAAAGPTSYKSARHSPELNLRARQVRPADFLAVRPRRRPFAVVGNIPYALTAAVVDWCLAAPALTTATLPTQLEYARKRTGDYGRWSRLTIATWPLVGWHLAGRVPRTAFRPMPRVDGGIWHLVRRPAPRPWRRRCVPCPATNSYPTLTLGRRTAIRPSSPRPARTVRH
jgi:16S rRNA A1518/A1519 N6-dimethyltransferase RsmA/KsgA/DIM1 with predicted DNA glycosylase/AP lyase activity